MSKQIKINLVHPKDTDLNSTEIVQGTWWGKDISGGTHSADFKHVKLADINEIRLEYINDIKPKLFFQIYEIFWKVIFIIYAPQE